MLFIFNLSLTILYILATRALLFGLDARLPTSLLSQVPPVLRSHSSESLPSPIPPAGSNPLTQGRLRILPFFSSLPSSTVMPFFLRQCKTVTASLTSSAHLPAFRAIGSLLTASLASAIMYFKLLSGKSQNLTF